MAAAMGVSKKCGFGSTATVDKFLEVLSENVRLVRPILYNGGLVGSRSQPSERTREGPRMVSGTIVCTPSAVELDALLPYIVGGAESTDTFPLAETLPSFYFASDRTIKVPVYGTCKVARATFSASQGGFLNLSMDIIGLDETVGAAGSFPAISLDVTTKPFVMTDGALTVNAASTAFQSFSFTIDNMLKPEWFNSLTITRINEEGRECSWSIAAPYGDTSALYDLAVAGVATSVVFTNGNTSLTIASTKVQYVKESATGGGREEILLPLNGVARKDGSTAEVVFTLDETP